MCSIQIALAAASAIGSIMQGRQQAQAARYNAQVAENNATMARQASALDAASQRRQTSRLLSAQRTAYGASGVLTEGTPTEVMSDTARMGELEALKILYGGEIEATNQTAQARLFRAQAGQYMIGGLMGAGQALVTGYGDWQKTRGVRVPTAANGLA